MTPASTLSESSIVMHAFLAPAAFGRALRALMVALSLAALPVHADEYSEVSRLLGAGQRAEALKLADQYLAGKPRDPQMRFLKGVVQSDSGQPDQAIATFSQIIREYPELPEPHNNLAVIYAAQGRYDQARASLDLAIRNKPDYATAHENLGDIYLRLAGQSYARALQLDAGNTGIPPKLTLIRSLFATNSANVAPPAGASSSPAAFPASRP